MYAAFLRSDYYELSAPFRRQQSTVDLPAGQPAVGREGQHRNGSHVHHVPVDRIGAQLCPCNFATPTPQTFGVASPPTSKVGFGVASW